MHHRGGGIPLILMCFIMAFPRLLFSYILYVVWPEMFWWMFTVICVTLFIMLSWQVYKWYREE